MVDSELERIVTEFWGIRPPTLMLLYSGIAVLGLLGLVGNVLSLVIWTRPQMKCSSSVLLTALAACYFLILLTGITPIYLKVLSYNYYDSVGIAYMNDFVYPHVSVWFSSVYVTAQTSSIYLTLAITLERYIAVIRPFRARLVCTYSKALKYTVAIIAGSIIYNLLAFLEEKVVAVHDDNGDIIYYKVDYTELGQSPLFQSIYELYGTWIRLIMIYLLPLICIAVLNTRIHREVKNVGRRRQAMTSSQKKENRTTMMLVYVAVEFLVCSSVIVMMTTIETLNLSREQLGFNQFSLSPLNNFFDTVNCSSNTLTYLVFESTFREAFLSTFSWLCPMKPPERTDGRELDVRSTEIPKCQPPAGNQTAEQV